MAAAFQLKDKPPYDNIPDLDPMRCALAGQARLLARICREFRHARNDRMGLGRCQAALGAFLLAGVARVVCVQHCTFFITPPNIGRRPYSSRCSARDSWLMAISLSVRLHTITEFRPRLPPTA